MTLDELAIGQTAEIVDVQGEDGIAIRLLEMGLTEGEEITLVGIAPLGDPKEYLIRSYRLSLRQAEAKRVTIIARQGTERAADL
ncbi:MULTISPECIES: ferrous iron transport protein A [unclassified Schlesneria]|uniref:FeoA family protein n=1 Tax=Schlesneria TaxID=656899 RepID=UPI002F2041D4